MGIGANIKDLRKKAGLTQQQLADKVNVNVQTIRSYEGDKYRPGLDAAAKLSAALGCTISELYRDDMTIHFPGSQKDIDRLISLGQEAAHASYEGFKTFLTFNGITVHQYETMTEASLTFDGSTYLLTREQFSQLEKMTADQVKVFVRFAGRKKD